MKIGVVADTNDNQDGLKQLLDRFLVGGMQWLLHCGGLGSASLVELLKPWQVHMVAGEREPNRQAIELALKKARLQAFLPTEMKLTLEGVRIGLCRNDAMNVVNQWIRSGQFDYIFHGFTLRRSDRSVGKTRIINPGALGGPRYQTRSGVLIDLAYGEVRAVSVLIYATEPHPAHALSAPRSGGPLGVDYAAGAF
jgi:uncharacterized protein